jgi:hypothetical protein
LFINAAFKKVLRIDLYDKHIFTKTFTRCALMQTDPRSITPSKISGLLKMAFVSAALFLTACGGGGGGGESGDVDSVTDVSVNTPVTPSTPTTTLSQPTNTTGRLLASNCFQCHGTGGVGGFENIRGSEASEVVEYLTRPASGDIMAAHAQGYTRAQLEAIIAYLKQ